MYQKFYNIFCITVLFFNSNLYTQNKLDSLKNILNTPNSNISKKIPILNQLIWRWNLINKDSSQFYLNQYRDLVTQLGTPKQKSFLAHFESKKMLEDGKFEEAIFFAKKSIEIAKENYLSNLIIDGFSDIGNIYLKMNKLDSALFYFQTGNSLIKHLNAPTKKGLKITEIRNNINIIEVLKLQGNYIKSLEIAQEALQICLKHNFSGYLANLYNLVGEIFFEVKDFNKAKENFILSINSAKNIKNIDRLSFSYENMAKYEVEMNNNKSAENYLILSYDVGKTSNNKNTLGRVLWKLARINIIQNKNYLAIENINKSIEILSLNKDFLELENAFKVKGEIYLATKEYSKSLDFSIKALLLNQKSKNKTNEMEIYSCLYESFNFVNDFQNALKYSKKYNYLKDSLMNFSVSRKITQIEYQKIYDTKVLSDSLLNLNKYSNLNLQHQKENTFSLIIIISSILSLIFSIYFYIFHKNNSKKLKINNELIENQKNEIKIALNQKEILLKEIHHRVKNNLQIILSLLELQSDSQSSNVLKKSQSRVQTMSLIHQKLYQTDNLAVIDMKEYISELSNYLKSLFYKKHEIKFIFEINKIELDIETAIPIGLILNELISNSLKYAFKENNSPKIQITINEIQKGNYQLIYKDNGVGFDINEIKNNKSLGLKLVKRLVDQLFGSFKIERENGMKFNIMFQNTEMRKEID